MRHEAASAALLLVRGARASLSNNRSFGLALVDGRLVPVVDWDAVRRIGQLAELEKKLTDPAPDAVTAPSVAASIRSTTRTTTA